MHSEGPGSGENPSAMIVSVGGSPAPVIASLNTQQPERICFFVSPESREAIDASIIPNLAYRPRHHDWIETESAEDLLACYRALLRGLPLLTEKWKVPLSEFTADYTGGTKTMSVALALATIQAVGRYTYIGGTERTKNGLGVVVDGKERTLYQANPWEELAVSARQRGRLLFAKGRYEAAAEEYAKVAARVATAEQGVYRGLAKLAEGYAEWDRFAHNRAQEDLSQSLRVLEPYAAGASDRAWTALASLVRSHVDLLLRMRQPENALLRVADLIANAQRRADLEARYDDAVARLYSALEMAARTRLETAHGIRPSRAAPLQIPASIREEFRRRYGAVRGDGEEYLKIPHYAAYRLLRELHDELAHRYFSREKEIESLMDQRNSSILAHGDRPVGEKVYSGLLRLVCEVVGVEEGALPRFPDLPA